MGIHGKSMQFSLRILFVVVACCALCAAVVRLLMSLPGWGDHLRSGQWLFAAGLVVTSLGLGLAGLFMQGDQAGFTRAYAVLCVVAFLSACSVSVVLYTVGEFRTGDDALVALLAFVTTLVVMSQSCGSTGLFAQGDRASFTRAYAALYVVVFLLVGSALVSWYTIGEVRACFVMFAALLAFVPALLCSIGSYCKSIAASMLIVVFAVPTVCVPQCVLVWRLKALQSEVSAIADYLYSEKQSNGSYPADLSDYRFVRPDLRPLVTYWSPDRLGDDNYILSLDLFEDDHMGREYSPRTGWYYYPD